MRGDALHLLAKALAPVVDRLAGSPWATAPRPPQQRAVVRGPGPDPDRVLLAGGGSAVGWGVMSHELGLAGHLARATSAVTHRGTDVEVFADPRMPLRAVKDYLTAERLSRYDAIVLTPGTIEAYELLPVQRWADELTDLIEHIVSGRKAAPGILLVGAEEYSPVPLPRIIGPRAMARARELNARTRAVIEGRPQIVYVDSGVTVRPDGPDLLDAETAPLYSASARGLAPALAKLLDHSPAVLRHPVDEDDRAAAVTYLQGWSDSYGTRVGPLLTTLRDLLHVRSADLFFVGHDVVTLLAATTGTLSSKPRTETLSTLTLEYPGGLIVPDLAADPLHRTRPEVTGPPHLRFYAGVPVESPEGHPVAVLSVVDTSPREFGPDDITQLRRMAALIGSALFEGYNAPK